MMNKQLFNKYKNIEKLTFVFDAIAIIIYLALFVILFQLLELPPIVNGSMDLDILQFMEPTYEFLGSTLDKLKMNSLISIIAIISIVAVPMLVVNIKKNNTATIYDYNAYTIANHFSLVIINLLSFNPISAGLRIYSTFVLIKFVKGYTAKEFFQSIPRAVKKFFGDRKEKKEQSIQTSDSYSLSIKKSIRRQTTMNAIRLLTTYLFLVIMALVIVVPFYWMIITSLKDFSGATSNNPEFFIGISRWNWINYKVVLTEMNFGLYIKNTLIVAVFSTIGTVVTTILSAYAFARIEFKGRELLFSLLVMTMMIPGELYIITNFITVSKNGFGWVGMPDGENQYFIAMIIPFITSISYIFFLRQNFKQIPESLYKAARVDGCSDLKYLLRVMVPIASPTIFTITILNVFSSWNAYIWPRIITGVGGLEGKEYWLISNALRDTAFVQEGGKVMYNLQIAASALVTVPLLIVFFAFRKYIMNGIGRSGTKG